MLALMLSTEVHSGKCAPCLNLLTTLVLIIQRWMCLGKCVCEGVGLVGLNFWRLVWGLCERQWCLGM